jgi:hypothetical protein
LETKMLASFLLGPMHRDRTSVSPQDKKMSRSCKPLARVGVWPKDKGTRPAWRSVLLNDGGENEMDIIVILAFWCLSGSGLFVEGKHIPLIEVTRTVAET